MVTTSSLNPDLDFSVNELAGSELSADREIAQMAMKRLDELVLALLPVIAYVDVPIGDIRGVPVVKDEGSQLILGREGKWYLRDGDDAARQGNPHNFRFSTIVDGLQKIFCEAMVKKETHLAAVAKRRELLDKISAAIHGESREQ